MNREDRPDWPLSDQSATHLSHHLVASIATPSAAVVQDEMQTRMRATIEQLDVQDREVLVARHLQQLSIAEVAAVLQVSQAAVQSRYRRALERLHQRLTNNATEED